jgi:protein ImuA
MLDFRVCEAAIKTGQGRSRAVEQKVNVSMDHLFGVMDPPAICPRKAPVVLHEVIAGGGHAGAAVGFGLALAAQTLASASHDAMLLWVREGAAVAETGDAYGPGLETLGLSPDCFVIVKARTHVDSLRAALEGARCAALAAVVLETLTPIDLTASRRLKLAAEKSGVAIVLVRVGSHAVPNAAQIRWRVQAAHERLKADGTQRAAFEAVVLKSPQGVDGKSWFLEWDHDGRCFVPTLPVPMDAALVVGSLAA